MICLDATLRRLNSIQNHRSKDRESCHTYKLSMIETKLIHVKTSLKFNCHCGTYRREPHSHFFWRMGWASIKRYAGQVNIIPT